MHVLVDWAVARGRMILAFVALSITVGASAYVGLPKEGAPNIDVPILYISTPLPGASASDVESLMVKPLETELRDLEGLKEMTATATEGHAGVLLEFDFGWDKSATVAETRSRVDRAESEFPSDAEKAQVFEVNLSEFPIVIVSLSGAAPERTLLKVAKDLQREIEALPPVLKAELTGHRDEMVEVLIDPLKLDAYNVTALELVNVVDRSNRLVPAGAIESQSGAFSVTVPGKFETAADVYGLRVVSNGDQVVTLDQIAKIRRTFEDARGESRYNGEDAIALQVKKRIGENILDTVKQVRAVVAAEHARWPQALRDAVSVNLSMDQSVQVNSMVEQLESSVLTAILMVMIVVIAALGMRSAALVGLAVPCSFLLAFALMAALGMSVNNMVMFGMILAVGMLVDGAIVVAEFADKRMSEGVNPRIAYAEAARRMFWPIVSSTATTLCAFLPMLLWPGMPGQFMSQLPTTLIFVLSASLLVALVYLPVLGGLLGMAIAGAGRVLRLPFRLSRRPHRMRAVAPAADLASQRKSVFRRFIEMIIGNPIGPFVTIGLAIAALFGSFNLYSQYGKGTEFFVKTEPEIANIYVRGRGNLSLAEKDRLVSEAERRVREVEGVAAVFAFTGEGGLQQEGGESPPDAVGRLQIELSPWRGRLLRDDPLYGDEILAEISERLADFPGGIAEVRQLKEGPQQGKPIQLLIASNDREKLNAAVSAARARFEQEPGLVSIDDTRPLPGIEWKLRVDRTAAGRFGADVVEIGAMVQMVTRGVTLDTLTPDDSNNELDIIARFPKGDRTLTQLERMMIRTENGLVPLSNFVTLEPKPKLGEIQRRDGVRFFLVRADVQADVNVNKKIGVLQEWVDENALEGDIRYIFSGDLEEQQESQAFLGKAFIGALGLMFVILLAQFNSVYNSLLVLSAVVMSIAGVLLGMLVMDQTFSIIMTGVGIVALAGIVVNNNIVLIDTFQEYRAEMPPLEAIARTAEDRLRPVLLTTTTTIAGLTPMMFATSIDFVNRDISVGAPTALWWVQLATAVIFGLGFSTMLTLVVTPSALAARVWGVRGVRALIAGAVLEMRRSRSAVWAQSEAGRDYALTKNLPRAPIEISWTDAQSWATRPDFDSSGSANDDAPSPKHPRGGDIAAE